MKKIFLFILFLNSVAIAGKAQKTLLEKLGYPKDSKLLIANSSLFQSDSLKYYNNQFGDPELYVWKNNNFESLQ